MTQAVTVRRDGDTFQARVFWLKAAKLLDSEGSIVRVGFESGTKGFDDVWVEYDPKRPLHDQFGQPLTIERLQCKWHAKLGTYTHVDLTLPEFINATSTSLLQRAKGSFMKDLAAGSMARVKLVTNHRVDPSDVLNGLIRSRSHTLHLDKLFEGKTSRSATGGLRQLWRDHLGVDDDELRALCATLGFSHMPESLDELRERVDETFRAYGLRPSQPSGSATDYDDLPFQWAAQGRLDFDRESFREICSREGLLAHPPRRSLTYGVKSFEHPIDRLEDRCEKVLDLVSEFDDRVIRDEAAWRSTLQPALGKFLREAAGPSESRLRLALDAHITLAFVAGTILDTKSGRLVEIEQRTPDRRIWAPDDATSLSGCPTWDFAINELDPRGEGIAVAIGITHDVVPKVRAYLAKTGRPLRQLLIARLQDGPSQAAVRGGTHANALTESIVAHLKATREVSANSSQSIHLFIAAPNAFTFYLGRHVQSLTPLTLYEFDFEGQRDRSYTPSISL